MSTADSGFDLYHYTPSKAAAIVFVVLFILMTVIYTVQTLYAARKSSKILKNNPFESIDDKVDTFEDDEYKQLKISSTVYAFLPFFAGCIMEVVGYIGRALSSSNPEKKAPYIIQSVLLLVAPALIAATIYMIFGRLLHVMRCQSLMLVSARFGTSFFVVGDVFSFFLQGAGGGLMSKAGSAKAGSALITAGLFVQVIFFGFFIINEIRFTVSVKRRCLFYKDISRRWIFVNATLLLSSVLILLRSIVRIIEFIQGFNGYIISHEYFIYVFDAVPMLLVIIAFSVGSFFGNVFDVIKECQTLSN
ncbi:CDG_1a_G0016350.mRNA.1.CDS.1 [Saccharomyces cerevisiae]|nr:BJ4_G0005220.mRNA.1.CDS.1 [Saccharomyces cerevisiae]CAI4441718.1 CDG_1a_G0016350.mRNA.1.CDS.1 [Saccharomyces cerevisiae]CAI4443734.1 BBL_G0016320.mRNA.1.CDS.1 [Saccharomyces cerevisiae]CAI7106608.1 BBL_G0016320.mRNA.1.CDS.1 [Saccharomyces cerevisiae]CAI7270085.1 CDG_1a_G0016350.mRNA.1.CDS.1 [Saccharomyces cerevisiae]